MNISRRLMIIGAGGHAGVLVDALQLAGAEIVGIVDPEPKTECIWGVKVIGDDSLVLQYKTDEILLVNAVASVRSTEVRQNIYTKFRQKGYDFAMVVHPAAIVSPNADLGRGVQVMAGAVVQAGAEVMENTLVNTSVVVEHDCRIGPHCHLAPGVCLSGNVTIGKGVHIGTGASIIQGVSVGEKALVAAGAVVVDDIPANATAKGVPAKVTLS